MRKIIYTIIISLLLCSANCYVFAEPNSEKLDSIEDKLIKMDLLAENDFEYDLDITRVDFVKMTLKYVGLYDFAEACEVQENVFDDVDKDNADAGFIKYAKEEQWLSGYEDRCCYPEYEIKFNQAVKIMVTVLGYKDAAELSGGYPRGYLKIAGDLKILDGVTAHDENISYANILKMYDNTLKAKVFTDFSEDSSFYEKYYNGGTGRGIISAVSGTSLYAAESGIDDDELIIDGKIYKTDLRDIGKYLGYYVEYFYTETNDELFITYVQPNKKNSVKRIEAADILSSDREFTDTLFVYRDENNRRKTEDLTGAAVIYNGRADALYSEDDIAVDNGFVEILDNDGNGKADCVFVYDFSVISVVSGVAVRDDSYYITDRINSGRSYCLEMGDENKSFSFVKEEKNVTIDAISENDVVMIGTSKDGSNTVCYISSANIGGKVTSLDTEEIFIDGSAYKESKWFEDLDNKDVTGSERLAISVNVTAYFDYFGQVAAIDYLTDLGMQYGFVMEAKQMEDDGGEQRVRLELLTKTGELEKVWLKPEKLKVNGKKVDNIRAYGILTEAKRKASNGDFTDYYDEGRGKMIEQGVSSIRQLIQYKLDELGNISELNTVTRGGELDFVTTFYATGYWYSYAQRNFMNKYYLANNGITFYINADKELSYVDKMKAQSPENDDNYKWQVYLYNENEDRTIDVVVIVDESGTGSKGVSFENTPKFAIVTGTQYGLNADEEICDQLNIWRDGQKTQIYTNSKMNSDNLNEFRRAKEGDIIFYTVDVKGNLSNVQRIYNTDKKGVYGQIRFSGNSTLTNGTGRGEVHGVYNYKTASAECQVTYARVDKKEGQYLLYHCQSGDNRVQYFERPTQKVYIVNNSAKKTAIETGSYQDIMPGDDILFTTQYSGIKEVIILRDR